MSLPKTIGLFRLTRNAELRYSSSGSAILKMGLACSEKFGDKESQCFIDATAFGKQAEIISQYAGEKGTQIFLTGKLQTESWADETSGQNRSKNSMIIESFDFVSKPKVEGNTPTKQNTGVNAPVHREKMTQSNLPQIDIDNDCIPF